MLQTAITPIIYKKKRVDKALVDPPPGLHNTQIPTSTQALIPTSNHSTTAMVFVSYGFVLAQVQVHKTYPHVRVMRQGPYGRLRFGFCAGLGNGGGCYRVNQEWYMVLGGRFSANHVITRRFYCYCERKTQGHREHRGRSELQYNSTWIAVLTDNQNTDSDWHSAWLVLGAAPYLI